MVQHQVHISWINRYEITKKRDIGPITGYLMHAVRTINPDQILGMLQRSCTHAACYVQSMTPPCTMQRTSAAEMTIQHPIPIFSLLRMCEVVEDQTRFIHILKQPKQASRNATISKFCMNPSLLSYSFRYQTPSTQRTKPDHANTESSKMSNG